MEKIDGPEGDIDGCFLGKREVKRLKPNLMVGGYGQFTYHFNYWGPTGVNRDTHVLVRKLPDLKW